MAWASLTAKPKLSCSIDLVANHRYTESNSFSDFLCKLSRSLVWPSTTFQHVIAKKMKNAEFEIQCRENWFSCHFLILIKSNTAYMKYFIFSLPPPTSIFKRSKSRFPIYRKKATHFPTKPNIFLKPTYIFPNIWQKQTVQFWGSLVSCADWLLKCKVNLYLADVKNMTLWDNDRFCNRLVVVLSEWNE